MAVDVENSAPHSDVTELWVEKYKPTSYAELLSDEVNFITIISLH